MDWKFVFCATIPFLFYYHILLLPIYTFMYLPLSTVCLVLIYTLYSNIIYKKYTIRNNNNNIMEQHVLSIMPDITSILWWWLYLMKISWQIIFEIIKKNAYLIQQCNKYLFYLLLALHLRPLCFPGNTGSCILKLCLAAKYKMAKIQT